MKIKALISFAGLETMTAGEVKDVEEKTAKDLINGGLVEAVADAKKAPAPKTTKAAPKKAPARKTAKK